MLLKISPDNSFTWINNPKKTKEYETLEDIMIAYKNKKLNFHFTSQEAKIQFEKDYEIFLKPK